MNFSNGPRMYINFEAVLKAY